MEQYNVKLLRRAVQDLDDIYSYIAQSLLEPETASRLLGRRVGTYANQGYRQLFVEGYTIIFRIEESKKQVVVVTVRSFLRQ